MIFVMTGDYRQFQSFMQDFHLREDFGKRCGVDGCKTGQVRYLGDWQRLRGLDHHNLVLAWGTWRERRDSAEILDYCAARDIPFMEVPDFKRERFMREHPTSHRMARW